MSNSGEESKKCNKCDFTCSNLSAMRSHLKRHNVNLGKSNKCNQCDYASSDARNLRTHLKIHSGEKPNKCDQCDYASSDAGNLRKHLKILPRCIQDRNLKDTF